MVKKPVLEEPVLDKIELSIPPRVTLKLATIATERGQTITEVLLDAVYEFIEKSKQ